MVTLSIPGPYNSTLSAQFPDGSFVSGTGRCPAGYVSAGGLQTFTGMGAPPGQKMTMQSGGAPVCIPAPVSAPAPAPAQVTTTVSPQIVVSPQVSPVFQQAFQPSNSPMTAGTTQVAPAIQAPAPALQTPSQSQQTALPSGSQAVAASAAPTSFPPQLPAAQSSTTPAMLPSGGQAAPASAAPAIEVPLTNVQIPLTNIWPWVIGIGIVILAVSSKEKKR